MARVTEDLLGHLRDQLRFLELSGQAFDGGHHAEAKRLATVVRVLVHDTTQSKSLLGQVKVKERMSYLNTCDPYNPQNVLTHHGLVMLQTTVGLGVTESAKYAAPLSHGSNTRRTPFTHWWQELVIKDDQSHTWTRRDVVLELANREGGAHVDPKLNKRYEALAMNNSLGWMYTASPDDKGVPPEGNPVYTSMRQIAYEVEMTLKDELPRRLRGFE